LKHNRFLIVRPDRIGDVVLSTPIPREIKKVRPDSFIAVMVTDYTKDIYLNNPHVDEIIVAPKQDEEISKKEFFSLARELRKKKFYYAFMLLPTSRINYLLFFAGIKKRIGVGHKFYQFITRTKSVNRHKYIPLRHEADYCLDMIRKIGILPESMDTEIFLSEKEKEIVKGIKDKLSPDGKIIVGINSTSGNSAPNMEPSEYRYVIDNLLKLKNLTIVVTDLIPPSILDNIPGVHYPCRGNKLRDSIINIAALDVMISASTGPMHIAAALKIPTVSLFCPLTACSPRLWGPLGNRNRIVLPQPDYCQQKCPGDPKKCTFSGEGGIDAKVVLKNLEIFMPEIRK
jgi:ADP-heptose:LPS heptosyltransferase